MGLLGKLAGGAVNWVTSPVRVVYHGVRVVANSLEVVGDLATGKDPQKNLQDLKDAGAATLFAGVQTATGPAGILIGAVEGDARKIVSGQGK